MNTAKDEVRKLLDRLPDEASLEDIQYEVYVLDDIRRGTEEIDRGDVVEHEEVKRRLTKWLDK
jgi:predicted transcriptional regulator